MSVLFTARSCCLSALCPLCIKTGALMHLSMLTPRVGGSGKGWGFDIFTKKNVKCHSLGRKFLGKIPHPRDEIVFLKYLVSGALYMSGDREITQIHLAV